MLKISTPSTLGEDQGVPAHHSLCFRPLQCSVFASQIQSEPQVLNYSGTPLNGHPSTADTLDITDTCDCPDCIYCALNNPSVKDTPL